MGYLWWVYYWIEQLELVILLCRTILYLYSWRFTNDQNYWVVSHLLKRRQLHKLAARFCIREGSLLICVLQNCVLQGINRQNRAAIFLPFKTESKGHESGYPTALRRVYPLMQWQNTKPTQLISGRDTFIVPTSNIRYCKTSLPVAPNLFPGFLFCAAIKSPNPKKARKPNTTSPKSHQLKIIIQKNPI